MDVADIQTDREQVKDQLGDRAQKLFQEFLETFGDENGVGGKYADDARNLSKPERNTLTVSYADIEEFNQDLATTITQDYYRIYPYLCRALMNFVRDTVDTSAVGKGSSLLKKQFYVSLTDVPLRLKVRELTTDRVGVLIKISGQVVRTHPVHPELTSGVFECLDCGTVIKGVEQQFKYTQPSTCSNMACQNRTRFKLNTYASKFVDFQKIRVQETQSELPRGSIPRSLEVVVRAEAVELPQAGDKCDFIGTLIVVPDVGTLNLPGAKAESGGRNRGEGSDNVEGIQGLKACGVRELHYRLAFLASSVTPTNPRLGGGEWEIEDVTLASMNKQMSETEWKHLFKMMTDKRLYLNLINSLFPTIHGNEEVKRGVLLQLFGGVAKTTEEGTSLRGDINVCIVGDPSTAKSQFLKQVADFSPRAVYTSGKASTAAGLTAAVVKDEESYEFVIEAGALMLADNGVCCIDEFDKMDPRDQVAIHEAMEQQTISITKAGIKATLNARTSILAAANPKGGRYERGKSLRQNIDMSAPIMSRFDLFFVLVDEPNEVADYAIAQKIVNLHAHHEETSHREYTQEEVLRYILFARQFKPQIGKEAASALVKYYKSLRLREGGANARGAWRVTVRQLESLIRLSEAHCRLECKDKVEKRHVDEAYRLLNKSIIRVSQPEVELDQNEEDELPGIHDDDEEMPVTVHQPVPSSTMDVPDPEHVEEGDFDGPSESIPDSQQSSGRSALRKKIKLSYDEFKSMADLILMYMRKQEGLVEMSPDLNEDGDRETRTEELRRSQIINWYLDEISDEIETEEELIQRKVVVEKVIQRLIDHDNAIISIVKTGMGKSAEDIESDPILVVHPNYNIDDGVQPHSSPTSRRRRH